MTNIARRRLTFEDLSVAYNQTSVKKLFKKYEEIGFIYPAKKELLAPHFQHIKTNWKKLLKSKDNLLWILNNDQKEQKGFASISVIKNSNTGLLAQHLVSDGNPVLSLKVMMAAQYKAEHHFDENEVRSSQNWFRPNNRYAYRIFASMCKKLGPEKSSLLLFQYLHLPLQNIKATAVQTLFAQEVTGRDAELVNFVNEQYGSVFTRAEELDQFDIQLKKLNRKFQKQGLERSRKVIKIKDRQTNKVIACVVANRAPLGLNFSFLENRAYYIVDKSLSEAQRAEAVRLMNATIYSYYEGIEINSIPIVTDEETSATLTEQGAIFFREYLQSIWTREGFPQWYHHIASFLMQIERRVQRKSTGS